MLSGVVPLVLVILLFLPLLRLVATAAAVLIVPRFKSVGALVDNRPSISTNSKAMLAEVGSYLYNARHPSYTWTRPMDGTRDTSPLMLELTLQQARFRCFFEHDSPASVLTALERKLAEQHMAALVVDYLASCGEHSRQVDTWRRHRQNKDNKVHVLAATADAVAAARGKVVVLVDAENVPDVRRCFYISVDGAVRFLSPRIPRALEAPALDEPAVPFAPIPTGTPAADNDDTDVDDCDLLVLTYAQERAGQAAWANRRTSSSHRDAADSLMLFDLGALSLAPAVRRLVLVTQVGRLLLRLDARFLAHPGASPPSPPPTALCCPVQDRFGANAASFFADGPDAGRFAWVTTCTDVARSLGRIVSL